MNTFITSRAKENFWWNIAGRELNKIIHNKESYTFNIEPYYLQANDKNFSFYGDSYIKMAEFYKNRLEKYKGFHVECAPDYHSLYIFYKKI